MSWTAAQHTFSLIHCQQQNICEPFKRLVFPFKFMKVQRHSCAEAFLQRRLTETTRLWKKQQAKQKQRQQTSMASTKTLQQQSSSSNCICLWAGVMTAPTIPLCCSVLLKLSLVENKSSQIFFLPPNMVSLQHGASFSERRKPDEVKHQTLWVCVRLCISWETVFILSEEFLSLMCESAFSAAHCKFLLSPVIPARLWWFIITAPIRAWVKLLCLHVCPALRDWWAAACRSDAPPLMSHWLVTISLFFLWNLRYLSCLHTLRHTWHV